jgi:hypothetical protein
MTPRSDGGVVIEVQMEGIEQIKTSGPCLVLMTRTAFHATPTAEEDTRSRLRSVVALLRLALGRNVAVQLIGEFILTPSTSKVEVIQASFRSPASDPAPNLSSNSLGLIPDLDKKIEGLGDQERNRVELSLQWCFRSEEEMSGINRFLMHWFAVDILAMPRSEGLGAVLRRLSRIYGLHQTEIQARFRLGLLNGLRDDIVHEGLHPTIHTRVLDFMSAVYWDLLLDTLGLEATYAARQILDAHDIDLWFPKTDRKRARQGGGV